MTIDPSDGTLLRRDYPNGLRAGVVPLLTGTGRIIVGTITDWDRGYERAFCYDTPRQAVIALMAWNGEGEPYGWFRNPDTGRRRPNGDKAQEYVWA